MTQTESCKIELEAIKQEHEKFLNVLSEDTSYDVNSAAAWIETIKERKNVAV